MKTTRFLAALLILFAATIQAAHVRVTVEDSTRVPITNINVVLLLSGGGRTDSTNLVSVRPITNLTDTAGQTTFSNVVEGTYTLTAYSTRLGTAFTMTVPDTNILLEASALVAAPLASDNLAGYTMAQANGLFPYKTNGFAQGIILSNLTVIGTYSGPGISNVVDLNSVQTFGNKIITNSTLVGAVSNAPYISGALGNLTNGNLYSSTLQDATVNAIAGLVSNVIGVNLTVTNLSSPGSGAYSMQLGEGAGASGDYALAIGYYPVAGPAANTIAIGAGALGTNTSAIAMGNTSKAYGVGSVAIGYQSQANLDYSTAVGTLAQAGATNSTALGYYATATNYNSTAIGAYATTTKDNQIVLGNSSMQIEAPGMISLGSVSNLTGLGSNRFVGSVGYDGVAVATMAAGGNILALPANGSVVSLSGPAGAWTLDGVQNGWPGRYVMLRNASTYTMTINEESGFSATAGDRINTGGNGNIGFAPNEFSGMWYDGGASRWRLVRLSLPLTIQSMSISNVICTNLTVVTNFNGTGSNYLSSAVVAGSMTFTSTNGPRLTFHPGPFLTNAPGLPGQLMCDTTNLYICIATNSWARSALSTW